MTITNDGTLPDWPRTLRRYLIASLALHFGWEIVQLPLYTLWTTAPLREQAFAVAHCTAGDGMIAGLTLLLAMVIAADRDWPRTGHGRVWLLMLFLGAAYTIYSEWMNVTVRKSWAYAPLMPTLPPLGTGLSPLLQWIIVPTLAMGFATGRWPWGEQH